MTSRSAASQPDKVLCTTAGKENFQRLTRLLICGGTSLLREIFDHHCPPIHFRTRLTKPVIKTLLKKAKLTKPQWHCLYPSPAIYGESKDFDITLLFKLLRTICGLTPPPTGWDDPPATSDLSLAADLVRIKNFRNMVYGHAHDMEISDDNFILLWAHIEKSLLRIAGQISSTAESNWQESINNCLTAPLTVEDERNVKELKRWYVEDVEVKKSLDDLKVEIEGLKEEIEKMSSELGEMHQVLVDGFSSTNATVLSLTIDCQTTPEQSEQNGIPSTQVILNLVASNYLVNVNPSTREELNDFVQYLLEVRKVLIVDTHCGSLIIKVKCSTLEILEDLWDDYCIGYLNEMAQVHLVTEEILKTLGLTELILTTSISDEKYRECKKYFLNFHGLASDTGNTTGSGESAEEVQWKKTEEQDVKNEELDDEPKEKDATFADDGPPWTKKRKASSNGEAKKIAAAASVGVAATAVGVLAAPVIAGAALGAAGFTSAGVAAGSIAAAVQSAVYGGSVAAGSLFALCQSAGATGAIGSAATAAIGGGTGLAGIAGTLGSLKLFGRKSDTIKLVICGSGDGAHVFAGIASARKETDVRVLALHEDEVKRWNTALQQKDLTVTFRCEGENTSSIVSKPALVTTNPEDAMRDAQMVIFMLPSACHQVYLEALASHLKPGTVIVGLPGNPEFESRVRHVLGEKAQQCTIMNFESLPWTCRTTEFGVKCEVTRTMDTLLGDMMKGNVPPKKDPVAALQYLLGPVPELKVSDRTEHD